MTAANLRPRGFTLLEIVVVLLLLGVLAAIVVPRLTGSTAAEAAFAERTAAALRYAQRLAVNSGCEIQVQVDAGADRFSVLRRSGGGDTACGSGGFSDAVRDPGGSGDFTATASGSVDVTQGLTMTFDAQGLPSPNGGSVVVGGRSITVEADSGYVH